MIAKLDKKDYWKVNRLLKREEEITNVGIQAIINGTNRGSIYVDDVEHPRTALIWALGTMYLFVGEANNKEFLTHLNHSLENEIKQESLDLCGGTWFICTAFDEEWEKVLEEQFAHKSSLELDYDYYFQFNQERYNELAPTALFLPDDYKLQKINAEVIKNDEEQILLEYICENWNSVKDFLTHGFGYCMVKGSKVLSVCFTCYVNGENHEISVHTFDEEDRKKGLATAACYAYINHCIEKGLVPHWTAYESNKASIKLAEKLGFQFLRKVRTYEFEF